MDTPTPEIEAIVHYIDEQETIEGAPSLKDEHLPVFDCAFKAANGERSIHYMGHIRMMGATQPFISGAISKTVNVPRDATVEDIEKAYVESWRLGAKAISIYRDGSKRTQPLNTSKAQVADTRNVGAGVSRARVREVVKEVVKIVERPMRRKLPDERHAITHKFDIAGHEGYITVGLFDDGTPGEIFLTMAKEGSTISGFATRSRRRSPRAAVRRAAAGAGGQVQPRALRAVGDDEEPRGALREVDRGLHLPLDGDEVPVAGSAVSAPASTCAKNQRPGIGIGIGDRSKAAAPVASVSAPAPDVRRGGSSDPPAVRNRRRRPRSSRRCGIRKMRRRAAPAARS